MNFELRISKKIIIFAANLENKIWNICLKKAMTNS